MDRNTENDRALGYLGLARRGGNLQVGDELVRAAVRAGKARMLVLSADAGAHTLRRARNLSQTCDVPLFVSPWTKEDIGNAVGKGTCAMAAFTEPRLALACLKALEQPPDEALLEAVTLRAERANRHDAEARAHEKKHSRPAASRRKQTK